MSLAFVELISDSFFAGGSVSLNVSSRDQYNNPRIFSSEDMFTSVIYGPLNIANHSQPESALVELHSSPELYSALYSVVHALTQSGNYSIAICSGTDCNPFGLEKRWILPFSVTGSRTIEVLPGIESFLCL